MSIPIVVPAKPLSPAPSRRLPPLPLPPSTLPHPSIRRIASETRPSKQPMRTSGPALPTALTSAWANDDDGFVVPPRRKYGLPSNPRSPTSINSQESSSSAQPIRTLRSTPDSRRVKPRELHSSTIKTMQTELGDLGNIHAHALALSGFYGGMDAFDYALTQAYARLDEEEEQQRRNQVDAHALDLAVSVAARKASIAEPVSRKGSEADTLLLPEFTLVHGAVPLSPGQGVPASPSSAHAPFEWDNPQPFGSTSDFDQPLFGHPRPMSMEERQSTYRKMSQPELEIELARRPRPATLQNQSHVKSDTASVTTAGGSTGRKRMGVILDGCVVSDEIERRFGAGKV